MQILLVEDDQPTTAVLTASLRSQHYQVSTATDGQMGLDLARQFDYDLILLDVELPKLDGIQFCQALRHQGNVTPVLLLTARESATDRILGLDAGADDYVIKPFDHAELLARVRALLRRGKPTATAALVTWNNLCLNPASREVRVGDSVLHLTPKEYGLLELFLLTPNRVFSRSAILDRLWNPAESPGEETVSTHIKCLRQKLEAAGVANPIKTVHGMGYRLQQPADETGKSAAVSAKQAKQLQSQCQDSSLTSQSGKSLTILAEAPEAQTTTHSHTAFHKIAVQAITTRVWQQSAHKLMAQVGEIERAIAALLVNCLTMEQQQQAAQAAHKLAGSLGIFGLHEGSRLAKQIEDWLQPQILLDDFQSAQLQDWVQALYRSLPPLIPPTLPLPQMQAMPEAADLPLILVILTESQLIEQLASLALTWGLLLEIVSPEAAQSRPLQPRPAAILLDLDLLDLDWTLPDQGLTLLHDVMQLDVPPPPTIILSAQDNLQNRLAVAQMGGVFLQKPTSVPDIFHAITHVLEGRSGQLRTANRIMVVDDDPTILTWISSLLQPLEIQVTGLNDPQQFWQVLHQTAPDLLVLDVEMPLLKGWQLCQMVRSDLKWQHLPILFLSNDSDAEQIDRAFQAGADDYFHKSNSASELVERILRRLKRAGQYPSQPFNQNPSQNLGQNLSQNSISNATQASLSRPCNKQDAPA